MNIESSEENPSRKGKLLFLFPHPVKPYIERIRSGEIPSERLYGVIELLDDGWEVEIEDSRFEGFSGRLVRFAGSFGINIISISTVRALRKCDLVIVKDEFSLMATLAAKLFGKKIAYIDSMFVIPRRWWKRWFARLNIRLADTTVTYSASQIELWSREFNVPKTCFTELQYSIDVNFYQPREAGPAEKPFVLAVGRDLGRDFGVLVDALDGTGIGLKLVTLPYLVEGFEQKHPWVEIHQRVPYEELFDLYAQSLVVAIPLKSNISYPSGIRGLLESLALGKATITTRTPVLEEWFTDGRELVFTDPDDVQQLREKIVSLSKNESQREMLGQRGMKVVRERFGMPQYAGPLEDLIVSLLD